MKKIEPSNFFNYYKDCYEIDNKAFSLDNIFATKYPYKWFVEKKEELLDEQVPLIPYFNKKNSEIEKDLELFALDKEFLYGAFFILGKNTNNPKIKDKRFCAPLVLFPAKLSNNEGDYFLRIDHENIIINRQALNRLEFKNSAMSKEEFTNICIDCFLSSKSIGFRLKKIFDENFSNIDTTELSLFPNVWPQTEIKKYFNSTDLKNNFYKIIPAAGTVLLDKTNSSQKVLTDLSFIAEENIFTESLNQLILKKGFLYKRQPSHLKSSLNKEQYKALQNGSSYTNSVIIGPPGTGKTHTISAIVADYMLKKKSVLVVSKTKTAVEVLRNTLDKQFRLNNFIVQTSGRDYKRSLIKKVKKLLSGIVNNSSPYYANIDLDSSYELLEESENSFLEIIEKELKLNELDFKKEKSILEKLKLLYYEYGYNLDETLWEHFFNIDKHLNKLNTDLKLHLINEIDSNTKKKAFENREDLSAYYDALKSDSFSEYKQRIGNINHENLLQTFPIWLAHLPELNSVLPLNKELFDVVIIDEATQCDIASALPAIYRAKKVIVAGDPNQLKHYSFVSKKQQDEFLNTYNLPNSDFFDYRNQSILDLYISKVQKQDQVTFLREHYRSTPSLIDFSNKQFYENQLEILKSTPEYTSSSQIEIKYVNGKRESNGINVIEADTLINKLDGLILKYELDSNPPSIGIISLFSDQVNYINSIIKKKYTLDIIKKFHLFCGTAFHFQGSEREIILLSLCVSPDSHHSAFIHANKPEVLNVAITRAKSKQYVFSSISKEDFNKESLLSQYLFFIESFNYSEEINPEQDQFQKEVIEELNINNILNIISGYPVAGNNLDLLIIENSKNYFIDLIGYPGDFTKAFELERYKTLSRIGIKCLPIHYSFWRKNRKKAITQILTFIKK